LDDLGLKNTFTSQGDFAMKPYFKGIFAALATPFEQEEISPEKLKDNIKKYDAFDLSGYIVLGSTGEGPYLSDQESEKIVQTAKETASPDKKIIVGTARESTKLTLEFTNRMAAFDIDAVLIRTPSYFKPKMNSEALKKHYLTIADQSKVPLLVYNIPQYTGISVDKELIINLSSHPNILGMKDSSGNLSFFSELIPHLSPEFSLLLGAGNLILPGLIIGASGGILRLAAVAPAHCVKLYKLFLEGKIEEARRLQLELIPLNKAITQNFEIPGCKYALDLLGYFGGFPRFPLLPLDEKGKKEIENILNKLGLLKKKS